MENTLTNTIEKLESLFSKFNEHFFDNELQKPMITVSPDTRGAYGWFTTWKAWQDNSDKLSNGCYEINLCAEYIARPFFETCGTLLHEMVHLCDLQRGIKDVSRGSQYHNKRFKETAEQHGLLVEKTEKYGFSYTKLSESSKKWIETHCIDENQFNIYRDSPPKLKSKQSTKKYVCPLCETIIRATRKVNVKCADCGVSFIEA